MNTTPYGVNVTIWGYSHEVRVSCALGQHGELKDKCLISGYKVASRPCRCCFTFGAVVTKEWQK